MNPDNMAWLDQMAGCFPAMKSVKTWIRHNDPHPALSLRHAARPRATADFFQAGMIPGEGKETQKRGERAKSASLARFFELPAKMFDFSS
jgi:hypothetical protein